MHVSPAAVATNLFLLQVVATLFMTGLIWFVQIVHYPLFKEVGSAAFVRYARHHATLTGYVVGGPMLFELATALTGLAPSLRPTFVSTVNAIESAVLVLLLWLATGLLQVPLHARFAEARDRAGIDRLVRSNWIRTVLWSARSALLMVCLHRAIR